MSETTTPPAGELSAETEEAGFYHEAGLNAAWTASRLAVGGLCFLFGAFVPGAIPGRKGSTSSPAQAALTLSMSCWMAT